jgi:hypothetical protein
MTNTSIKRVGYTTGLVRTTKSTRNSVAFDLTGIDLADVTIVSALMYVAQSGRGPGAASEINLMDPSHESTYARGEISRTAGIPLTAVAVADLQRAGGSYFYLDAEIAQAADGVHSVDVPRNLVLDMVVAKTNEAAHAVRVAA